MAIECDAASPATGRRGGSWSSWRGDRFGLVGPRWPAGKLTLGNGYVQFAVASGHQMAADDAGEYAAVYIVPQGPRGYSASRVYTDDRWPEPLGRIRRTARQELTLPALYQMVIL